MTVLEVLPDGCIQICHEGHCGTVSSYHLVEPKLAQLRALATRGLYEGREGQVSGILAAAPDPGRSGGLRAASGAMWHAGAI
jgi:hypothetical protein